MPAVALSRAGARVVESGADGANLATSTWQRLETLPDPRSPQGRIYPLPCLIAIAVCAFTAAGNDRLHRGWAVVPAGQPGRSGPPARSLGSGHRPVPGTGSKQIRVVLDKLHPRALTRALAGRGGAVGLAGRQASTGGR